MSRGVRGGLIAVVIACALVAFFGFTYPWGFAGLALLMVTAFVFSLGYSLASEDDDDESSGIPPAPSEE